MSLRNEKKSLTLPGALLVQRLDRAIAGISMLAGGALLPALLFDLGLLRRGRLVAVHNIIRWDGEDQRAGCDATPSVS